MQTSMTAMKQYHFGGLGKPMRAIAALIALLALGWGPGYAPRAQELHESDQERDHDIPGEYEPGRDALEGGRIETRIDNNQRFRNPGGRAATFSTQGFVDLTGEYFQAKGTNGRSCASCHIPAEAWSITAATLQRLFRKTGGTDPVFNLLDANNPETADISTVEGRRAAYSMLLSRGVFRRGGALKAEPREWDLIAVEDPHGFANLNRLVQWRRSMPTINFASGSATVNWDGGNTMATQRAGLENQAGRNVVGPQQGLSPATPEFVTKVVDFETSLSTAQLTVPGVGRLDADGAHGGPEALSFMPKVEGRFDLFDAWRGHSNPRRAQIARGQELFNNINPGTGGRSCGTCHNAANNGTNIDNLLFDIGTASAEARTPDLALHTLRNRATGEIRKLTDTGRGNVTGLWNDLGNFKTPTLRALAARAPYFHNGIAATLDDVVHHYETHLGFIFTNQERADLVAFLNAL
jgi:cytochrome c peroxidase